MKTKSPKKLRHPDYNRWSKNISYLAKLEGLSSKQYRLLYNIPEYAGPKKIDDTEGKVRRTKIKEEVVEYEFPVSNTLLNNIDNNLKILLGKSYKKLLFE